MITDELKKRMELRINAGCDRANQVVDDPNVWSGEKVKEAINSMRFDLLSMVAAEHAQQGDGVKPC